LGGQQTELASNAGSVLANVQVRYVTYYDPYRGRYFQMPVATQNDLAAKNQNAVNEQEKTKSATNVASAVGDGVQQAGFDATPSNSTSGYSVFQSASKIPVQESVSPTGELELPYLESPAPKPANGSGGTSVIESGGLDIDLPALNPADNGK
jgi:hypothetical protein